MYQDNICIYEWFFWPCGIVYSIGPKVLGSILTANAIAKILTHISSAPWFENLEELEMCQRHAYRTCFGHICNCALDTCNCALDT